MLLNYAHFNWHRDPLPIIICDSQPLILLLFLEYIQLVCRQTEL